VVLSVLTIAAVSTLACANGANDVSKGIATLAGSRRATYRQAIGWGTLWTAVLAASVYTMPVFTTHVSTGAIVGAGIPQGGRAVEWGTVTSLVSAWFVTVPVSAIIGSAVVRLFG